MSPTRRSRTARSILEDPNEGHKLTNIFYGATHAELTEKAVAEAKKFFGEDDRYWFFVEGFVATSQDAGKTYRAELTIKRLRVGAEDWEQRLREVVREHEDDETTSSCHAHEEDRPCCIDYIAGLDGTEYEDRPTRAE